jgi:hypothetical protein
LLRNIYSTICSTSETFPAVSRKTERGKSLQAFEKISLKGLKIFYSSDQVPRPCIFSIALFKFASL